MGAALVFHRFQFAFTVAFHYIFPQLTMGLALLLVCLKTKALSSGDSRYDAAARFWSKIFAINFVMGVVTGIPMEFQFGTNWARFSQAAGGVIGQTLAMEGVFAFFLESAFLGLFLFGERRLSRRAHWVSCLLVFVGSWTSGYFIVATNAFMQHPVAFAPQANGQLAVTSLWGLLGNPWLFWQYLHTMLGAVATACFVVAGIGAYYLLSHRHEIQAKTFVRLGVCVGFPACALLAFPTGDHQARNVQRHQPVSFAAMEGVFHTTRGAGIVLIGQPDMERERIDNPIEIPEVLSFLTFNRWTAEVKGLDAFPKKDRPQNIPLLYYCYHVMVGLGTIFLAVLALALLQLLRKRLFETRWTLWLLLLLVPFPYIANLMGWFTAELGRQPWVIFGVMRTHDASSPGISSGNALFTLLGFMGLYALLTVLFLTLVSREIGHGPAER